MMDIDKLLKSKRIEIYKSKYFSYYCIKENGISELISITIFGKKFNIPHKLRKLTRHKERF